MRLHVVDDVAVAVWTNSRTSNAGASATSIDISSELQRFVNNNASSVSDDATTCDPLILFDQFHFSSSV